MGVTANLSPNVNSFLPSGLLRMAAAHKGLELYESAELGNGSSGQSKPIKTYVLDDQWLSILAQCNIRRQDRSDVHDEIFTLVDDNPQQPEPGYSPSNFWNFKPLVEGGSEFNLQVSLYVNLVLDRMRRGIVLLPRTSSTHVSAADPLPNIRMFRALVEHDPDATPITKELAVAGPDGLVVRWSDLGLGGLRSVWAVFSEFAAGNMLRDQLAHDRRVFDPSPLLPLFVAETVQPDLIQAWRAQLDEYCAQLKVG